MTLWILLIVLAAGAIGAIALGDSGTIAGMNGDTIVAVVASLVLLAFVSGALRDYVGRLGAAVRDFGIWVAFALVLVLGYSFRDDLRPVYDRLAGELTPPGTGINISSDENGERAVRIRKRQDGHFAVRSEVNGQSVMMLVDTGASSVVLTIADARAAGINVNDLQFTIPVSTANGTGFAAAVRIQTLAVGGILRSNLKALVAKPGALRESLLGIGFLQRLKSYEFSGDYLTLRG